MHQPAPSLSRAGRYVNGPEETLQVTYHKQCNTLFFGWSNDTVCPNVGAQLVQIIVLSIIWYKATETGLFFNNVDTSVAEK